MPKGGKNRKRSTKNVNQKSNDFQDFSEDDEIDTFHKQRDIVPLDINDDLGDSDENYEQPVFGLQDEDDDDVDDDDDIGDTGLVAKIKREQKKLQSKIGGVEDEMDDDAEEAEEKRAVWGRRKEFYHGGDNIDYEIQSSDEELPAEEEAEVLRLQKEKAKSLSKADFGLDDSQDDSDADPTFEDILDKGKPSSKHSMEEGTEDEIVKKDLNAFTTEEKMDVVYSAAPELVGLLTELNDATEQLENIVNPLLSKLREGKIVAQGGLKFLELKQLLLLSYCQAITFYLLLKSEGQPVRDHPIIARLVDIKNLLEKMKTLDENLPTKLEDILDKELGKETEPLFVRQDAIRSDLAKEEYKAVMVPVETKSPRTAELVNVDSMEDFGSLEAKSKHKDDQVGLQSIEMLKVRAALEEKLKQKGVFSSIEPKNNGTKRNRQPLNRQLETLDDFDDDTTDIGGRRETRNGHAQLSQLATVSKIATQAKKTKLISGDDDLPRRDDIGERRRNHELRVLAGAGIKSNDYVDEDTNTLDADGVADMEKDNETEAESESDIDVYKKVEAQRKAKLAAKSEKYSRAPAGPSLPDTLVEGKRHINPQIEKNRGLTRTRKKSIKNPRKKYKLKHEKAVKNRQGQVRNMKKPSGPYGGETSGINAGISRSIRFKS